MRLTFQNGFWAVHISFFRMVKFKLLSQFPVDSLPHPVLTILLLSLIQITAIAYYVIDYFISIPTESTSAILLRLIFFCFMIICPHSFVLCCYRKRYIFYLMFPFQSHIKVFACGISLARRLIIFIHLLLFSFLFSGLFCFLDACVLFIVSGGCNRSSSRYFSLNLCINASMLLSMLALIFDTISLST